MIKKLLIIGAFLTVFILVSIPKTESQSRWDRYASTNEYRLSLGGATWVDISGYNYDMDIGGELLGGGWDTVYTPPTTHSVIQVTSTAVGDTQDILIDGLDSLWVSQLDTVTLNGATKVATTKQWIRINEVKNIESTAYAGTVYVFLNCGVTGGVPNVTANIISIAPDVDQKSTQFFYTIPAGYTGYLYDLNMGSVEPANNVYMALKFYYRPYGKQFYTIFTKVDSRYSGNHSSVFRNAPFIIAEKSDIKVENHTNTNNLFSAGFCQIILVEN